MNIEQVLNDFRREQRTLVHVGEVIEVLPHVTRRSWPALGEHNVSAFDMNEENADAVIEGERARYAELGAGFEWKVFSFDAPPDLRDRLAVQGFEVGPREAMVIYDLAEGLGPFAGEPVEVRRIERVEQLGDFRTVSEGAFKKDYSPTTNQLAEALRNGETGHDAYVAYVDGVPASVGRLYTDPESVFAGLYGGGTLAEYRGRGLYRAVIAARARHAAALGVRYLQVDALPTSIPILLRLGFVHVADTWPCTWGG